MICGQTGSCGQSGSCRRQRLQSDADDPEEYKVAVLGAPDVGKTALCRRFVDGDISGSSFRDSNEMCTAEIVDNEVAMLNVVDITVQFPIHFSGDSGHLNSTLGGADGFLLVYSVTDRRGLWTARQILTYLLHMRKSRDFPVVLVGSKMDLASKRCVGREEGQQLSFDMGVAFYETSAKLADWHVTKVFHDLVRQIRCVRHRQELEKMHLLSPRPRRSLGSRGIIDRISFRTKKGTRKKPPPQQ